MRLMRAHFVIRLFKNFSAGCIVIGIHFVVKASQVKVAKNCNSQMTTNCRKRLAEIWNSSGFRISCFTVQTACRILSVKKTINRFSGEVFPMSAFPWVLWLRKPTCVHHGLLLILHGKWKRFSCWSFETRRVFLSSTAQWKISNV